MEVTRLSETPQRTVYRITDPRSGNRFLVTSFRGETAEARRRTELAALTRAARVGVSCVPRPVIAPFDVVNAIQQLQQHGGSHGVFTVAAERCLIDHFLSPLSCCGDGGHRCSACGELPSDPTEVAMIGAKVADSLDELHRCGMVHGALQPSSIAFLSPRHVAPVVLFELGRPASDTSLQFSSPEATGRTEHSVDQRSDLYSLGAVLYACLVGSPPFRCGSTADELEIAHMVIAKRPDKLPPSVPPILSSIVLKLLEKDPSMRYSTARGLASDLRRFVRCCASPSVTVDSFNIGADDDPSLLQQPNRMHGRADELAVLASAMDAAARGKSVIVSLSGTSGQGKKFLLDEFRRVNCCSKAVFGSTSFDGVRGSSLVSHLWSAIDEAVATVISSSVEKSRSLWHHLNPFSDSLRGCLPSFQALRQRAAVGVGVPASTSADGSTAPQPTSGAEFQIAHSIQAAMTEAIMALDEVCRPLVLLIHNAHLIDSHTFGGIKEAITRGYSHTLLVLSYRTNEAERNPALVDFLGRVPASPGGAVERMHIFLEEPTRDSLAKIISGMILEPFDSDGPLQLADALQNAVHSPFQVVQLMFHLKSQGLIAFDGPAFRWKWDIGSISKTVSKLDVTKIVARRIKLLPDETRRVLFFVAIMGPQFSPASVAAAMGIPEEDVVRFLRPAIPDLILSGVGHLPFHVVHRSVIETALSVAPPGTTIEAVHRRAGVVQLAEWRKDGDPAKLSDAIFHFEASPELIDFGSGEAAEVAELALRLAIESSGKAAFAEARHLCKFAQSLVADPRSVNFPRDLAFDLGKFLGRIECVCGNNAEALAIQLRTLEMAVGHEDRASIFADLSVTASMVSRFEESFQFSLKGLAELGISLEPMPDGGAKEEVIRVAELHGSAVFDKRPQPKRFYIARDLLENALQGVWNSRPQYLPVVVTTSARLCIDAHSQFPLFRVSLAMALGTVCGEWQRAFDLSLSAVETVRRDPDFRSTAARVIGLHIAVVAPWRQPMSALVPLRQEAMEVAMSTGDFQGGSWAASAGIYHMLFGGRNLIDIIEASPVFEKYPFTRGNVVVANMVKATFFAVDWLARSRSQPSISDTWIGGEEAQRFADSTPEANALAIFCVSEAMSRVLTCQTSEALRALDIIVPSLPFVTGLATVPLYNIARCLAVAGSPTAVVLLRGGAIAREVEFVSKMADDCPDNFLPWFFLIRAEISRPDESKFEETASLYDKAMSSAESYGLLHAAAFSALAAMRWWSGISGLISRSLADRAVQSLKAWGVCESVTSLLMSRSGFVDTGAPDPQPVRSDVPFAIRIMRSVASELEMNKLVAIVVHELRVASGAHRAVLALSEGRSGGGSGRGKGKEKEGDKSVVIARAFEDASGGPHLLSVPINELEGAVRAKLVDQVISAGSPVVQRGSHSSLMCMPFLLSTSVLVGVVLLEHPTDPSCFTQDKVDLLRSVSSQVAISLEHSKHYKALRARTVELEAAVNERTAELARQIQLLEAEISERDKAERQARENEEQLMRIFDNSVECIWLCKAVMSVNSAGHRRVADYFVQKVNKQFIATTEKMHPGVPGMPEEVVSRTYSTIEGHMASELIGVLFSEDDFEWVRDAVTEIMEKGTVVFKHTFSVGTSYEGRGYKLDESHFAWSFTDTTEQTLIEQQVQRTERLGSLVTMAGGIAHDQNNLMQVIVGNMQLALGDLQRDDPVFAMLSDAQVAAQSAAKLSQQLMSFTGTANMNVMRVEVNTIVRKSEALMRRLIGKQVTLELQLFPSSLYVMADVARVQQIIMSVLLSSAALPFEGHLTDWCSTRNRNLAANSSEAMLGKAGRIVIGTSVRCLNASELKKLFYPGAIELGQAYCSIEVTDTGEGMTQDTLSRCFEPFFSTRFIGRGMGLPAVLGIVKSFNGGIDVQSHRGVGSVFTIYLPLMSQSMAPLPEDEEAPSPVLHRVSLPESAIGRVALLVDDEPAIRVVGKRLLEKLGMRVILACNGQEAIDVFAREHLGISVVLMDLSMPGMTGRDALPHLHLIDPSVPVFIASGSNPDTLAPVFAGVAVSGFLVKPFDTSDLIEALSTVFPQ